MAQKPSIPKGTRDFLPTEMTKRNYIFDTIKNVFQKFGYQAIETPAMENLTTLLGKYGEEGDRLLFKILNSGDFFKRVNKEDLSSENLNQLSTQFCEKGLRYDLTVPFARFVVQHQNELVFPFKRYQIQAVWRADRPQAGRYREFFQCDVDVIGSKSLFNEAELILIINEVFEKLELDVTLKINNRKILSGLASKLGISDRFIDLTVAIDKLDKIGLDGVINELANNGFSKEIINGVIDFLNIQDENENKLVKLKSQLGDNEEAQNGIEELEYIFKLLENSTISAKIEFDQTLARGLNYYTGAIFEVKSNETQIGSICGGGRYDDLTGIFGLKDLSGVGISFGADRIYDVIEKANKFPKNQAEETKILITNFGEEESKYGFKIASEFRKNDIKCELFPDSSKLKKQMNYANKKSIPFVLMLGKNEIESGNLILKNMISGEQKEYSINDIIDILK